MQLQEFMVLPLGAKAEINQIIFPQGVDSQLQVANLLRTGSPALRVEISRVGRVLVLHSEDQNSNPNHLICSSKFV